LGTRIFDMDELEVRAQIDKVMRATDKFFLMEDGKRVRLNEVIRVREFTAMLGLIIAYSAGSFMTIDRLDLEGMYPVRQKRIINRLDCYSGQVSSSLMLELLQLRDKTRLSKYDLISHIQNKYFKNKPVGTRDITESLNRMLRKTMNEYFFFENKYFRRAPFELRMIEVPARIPYEVVKLSVDNVIQL